MSHFLRLVRGIIIICVGGLAVIPGTRASNTPFYSELISKPKLEKFTAIIHAVQTVPSSASPIIKLIKSLWKSTYWNVLIFLSFKHQCVGLHNIKTNKKWPSNYFMGM